MFCLTHHNYDKQQYILLISTVQVSSTHHKIALVQYPLNCTFNFFLLAETVTSHVIFMLKKKKVFVAGNLTDQVTMK